MYKRTTDRRIALANGYIGEIPMSPTTLARDIGLILGKRYVYFTIYFYGAPDEHLRKKFDIDEESFESARKVMGAKVEKSS